MDDIQKKKVLAGLTQISAMFRSMSPSSQALRNEANDYPPVLRETFTQLARGNALPDNSVLDEEWRQHAELGSSYAAAIFISDKLKEIDAAGIKESGPRNFQHMVSNPASYNPPGPRGPRRGFPTYD